MSIENADATQLAKAIFIRAVGNSLVYNTICPERAAERAYESAILFNKVRARLVTGDEEIASMEGLERQKRIAFMEGLERQKREVRE